ncbi:MAG: WYL domain-containing protein [Euryarchaeota archaeon]|nr:WYL domain-containing protein [Euryarchaeota archaeon]
MELTREDAWLAAVGAKLLEAFESEGASLLEEFRPRRLALKLGRKLDNAERAHLDYVVKQILEWRWIPSDFEGDMPWDEDEPWTGPSYDATRSRQILRRAIKEGLDVEMEYYAHSRGDWTTRRVTPTEIAGRYLIAYCHLRKDERTFRIERIASIRISPSSTRKRRRAPAKTAPG